MRPALRGAFPAQTDKTYGPSALIFHNFHTTNFQTATKFCFTALSSIFSFSELHKPLAMTSTTVCGQGSQNPTNYIVYITAELHVSAYIEAIFRFVIASSEIWG